MGNTAATFYRNRASIDVDRKVFSVIGGVGILCALTVFVEMCEKLGGSTSPNWSALRLMGPQIWIPLKSKEDYNIAIIILIFSIMYAAACCLLIYGGWNRVKDLSLTWKLTECGVLAYQIIAALITASSFSAVDSVLLVLDTLLGAVALIYTRIAEITWQEELAAEEGEERQPSAEPSVQEISEEAGPSRISSQEARRSLEAVAGPSGEAGPSGLQRRATSADQLQLREIDADSDSLEDLATAVFEPPPPPRPVISPRKKSSARTTRATVHPAPRDLQEISVAADPELTLGAVTEESASDRSHGPPQAAATTTPPRQPASAEGSETSPEGSPQGAQTSAVAEPAMSTEQAVVAEAAAPQKTSPSKEQFLEQMLAEPEEASYVRPRLSSGTSPVRAEAETTLEQRVPSGDASPSQESPSAAASTAESETTPKPSTDTVVSSLSVTGRESSSPAEADAPQGGTQVDTVIAAADSQTEVQEGEEATKTTDEATGAEVSTEIKDAADT